jgi:hypothetical protein
MSTPSSESDVARNPQITVRLMGRGQELLREDGSPWELEIPLEVRATEPPTALAAREESVPSAVVEIPVPVAGVWVPGYGFVGIEIVVVVPTGSSGPPPLGGTA